MAVPAKAAATLEGIVRTPHPDIDLIGLAQPLLEHIVRQRLSPQQWLGETLGEGSSIASMLRQVPDQVDQLLHDFESGHLQLRVLTPELDPQPDRLHALGGKLSLAARFGQAARRGDPGTAGRRLDGDRSVGGAAGAGFRPRLGGAAVLAGFRPRQSVEARAAAAPVAALRPRPALLVARASVPA